MTTETKTTTRCAECDRIKQDRRQAVASGDIERSTELTTLMGMHLRKVHG